ncbi:MAG: DNA gyrase subunit A [Thiotrichales bacterium]|nr:MAG: DNA gyrase subunit A [Thiotrichales bacterium]
MSATSEIITVSLEEEITQSYMDYAMSVIVGRALPDVRDGLKPVHRRILFAMRELHNDWNKSYKKSARIVGDVIGKYHPHGDTAVYDSIVRMAQNFSMRYQLVDGQGNFGSVDGDAAAAMRYTEVRMAKITHSILADLDKDTVDFVPNYDGSEMMPSVLPTRIPTLLVNGSSGIAVGMATNIPPHNLVEVIDACLAMIENPDITIDELLHFIKGPDFPTAGIINGSAGISSAYRTGRGLIYVRARTHTEEISGSMGRHRIVVTELPYQVNKAKLVEKIAELVKEKTIEGISELRDESDKDGMRMVVELKRGEVTEVVLNNLYKYTKMQNSFGINMVALIDNQPKVLNLQQILQAFVQYRQEVVVRRTIFELKKAKKRTHLLEGLGVALENIDEVIKIIKQAKNATAAKEQLRALSWHSVSVKKLLEKTDVLDEDEALDIKEEYGFSGDKYKLSSYQVDAILDMKLQRLTGLEREKIFQEYETLLNTIKELYVILNSHERLMEVICTELEEIKEQFGDKRITEINASHEDLSIEDLITEEEVVITLSHTGYMKMQPIADYQTQHRGGRGKSATSVKEEDFITKITVCSNLDTLLLFSSLGKVYRLKAYQVPQAGRQARGKPVNNLISIEANERITAVLPIQEFSEDHYIFMATKHGVVKKTVLSAFKNIRSIGIYAVHLDEKDELMSVAITDNEKDIMLCSNTGKAIRFSEKEVRSSGRTSRGVRGMRLKEKQDIISLLVLDKEDDQCILIGAENGYGKCSLLTAFRNIHRGGQGVIAIPITERNGKVVSAVKVSREDSEVMLITKDGILIRTKVSEIPCVGRAAKGVKLINITKGAPLVGIRNVSKEEADVEYETDAEDAESTTDATQDQDDDGDVSN